ncbi:MAG: ketoacyl-ACP synthase III [Bacteroidota bacterium]
MYLHHVAHYLPEVVVPNSYFTELNGLTDEWLVARTGIKQRVKAAPGENSHTMAVEAVKKGLENLPYPKDDIDLIVAATYTPFDTIATMGHLVQKALNKPHIPVVTISTACSSLLNAVEIAQGYMAMGKSKRALVVASDHNTAYAQIEDPKSGHLWGDGAVAYFLSDEPIEGQKNLEIVDLVTGGAACIGKGLEGVVLRPREGGLFMPHGRDVFIHAVQYMGEISRTLLDNHQLTIDDVDYFVPHQANFRISKKVAQDLNLPIEKVVSNIQTQGNTGAAGCGIAISQTWDSFQKGDTIINTVFGGGYSYGGMLLKVH